MASFSKFTRVSVVANLSLEEAGAMLHCLNYTIGAFSPHGDRDVLRHLIAIRASLLNAGVKVDGKSPKR